LTYNSANTERVEEDSLAARAEPARSVKPRAEAGGDDEKKSRIIAAALSEFAMNGYKNANTNRIVKEAGVSKGLLFHYFGSKKQLYMYLFDYAMRLISDEFIVDFDRNERDIFKRWRSAAAAKFDMMQRYGMLFEFILDAYVRADSELRPEIDISFASWIAMNWNELTERVDMSLFREDIDANKAVKIIYWTIEGYSRSWITNGHRLSYYQERYEDMISELDAYLDMLKRLLYRQ
jgi:AcrR family transcriptional regulator